MPHEFANLRRKQNAPVFSQVADWSADRDIQQRHQDRKDAKHILTNSIRICCRTDRHETLGGTEIRSFWAVPLHTKSSQNVNKKVAFQRKQLSSQIPCLPMCNLTRAYVRDDRARTNNKTKIVYTRYKCSSAATSTAT